MEESLQMLSRAFGNSSIEQRKDINGIQNAVNALVGVVSSMADPQNGITIARINNQVADQSAAIPTENNNISSSNRNSSAAAKKTISKQIPERAQRRRQNRTYKQALQQRRAGNKPQAENVEVEYDYYIDMELMDRSPTYEELEKQYGQPQHENLAVPRVFQKQECERQSAQRRQPILKMKKKRRIPAESIPLAD